MDIFIVHLSVPINEGFFFKMDDSKLKSLFLDFAKFIGEKDKELSSLQKSLSGNGSPEGKITASKGTVYTDNDVTNGAVQWTKTTATGNTGWKVTQGDTGWVNLNNVNSVAGRSFIKVRRVNDQVFWWFGGGAYDLFGIVGWNDALWLGKPPKATIQRNPKTDISCVYLCYPGTDAIPNGFRSPNSIIGPVYKDDNSNPIGVWKLGGVNDANQFRLELNNNDLYKNTINNLRFSTVTYLTNDPWPTRL